MFFRSVHKSDYPAVDALLMQLHRLDLAGRPDLFAPADHYFSREAFESLLENDCVLAFLAQERSEILGCCFVSLLERSGDAPVRTAYVDLLVVDEAHRRQGIGKAFFREIEKRAKRHGAQKVELMVWNYNQTAIRAYESYGLTPQRSIYETRI